MVKAPDSRAKDPGFDSPLAPRVIGSALGLVDPMSVYCDWVG